LTRLDFLFPHVAAALLAAGGAFSLYLVLVPRDAWVRSRLENYAAAVDGELAFQRLPLRGRVLTIAQVAGCATIMVAASALRLWMLAAFAVPVAVAPRLWLERRRAVRVSAIEGQLAEWLVSVSGAIRAGNSLGEALRSSIAVTSRPMRDEIEQTLCEYALGVPLHQALEGLSRRVRSRTVASAVFILGMGRETGGDLPATLSRAASSLREMARLEGVVRTKTAEGKAQAFVISVIPGPLVLLIDRMSPGYFAPLTGSPMGYLVIGGAVALWLVAIVAAARIVAVEV
jgi:tight adherence protein B